MGTGTGTEMGMGMGCLFRPTWVKRMTALRSTSMKLRTARLRTKVLQVGGGLIAGS